MLEHLDTDTGRALLDTWLPRLRPGGRVVLICPQERGFASDATHVRFLDAADLVAMCRDAGLLSIAARSFPLPRWCGGTFVYNETVVTANVPTSG
ncbi:MAG: hypothetical protein QM733_09880 [Ilumatobacteraceae bacterium]